MQTLRRLAGPLALVLVVAACAGAAAPSASPAPSGAPTSPSAAPTDTSAPSLTPPASDDPDGSVATEAPHGPSTGPGDPPLTIPKPGQLDLHPVAIDTLSAIVDGRRVVITATWTSGVEPCYVLDHTVVERDGQTLAVTVIEGHGPGDTICIEIAKTKQTQIDLGELAPGTYTITDSAGRAVPIEVTVS
jgi:hypothetical protein